MSIIPKAQHNGKTMLQQDRNYMHAHKTQPFSQVGNIKHEGKSGNVCGYVPCTDVAEPLAVDGGCGEGFPVQNVRKAAIMSVNT